MSIHKTILEHKAKEVAQAKELYPVRLLEKSIHINAPVVSLKRYLTRQNSSGIIAEIKRASPSKGIINKYINVEQLSIGYMQAGAAALSVLTDNKFFSGSNLDLSTARRFNFCPILRKDFIIDEYQILEARSIGADVVLLIAAALERQQLSSLAKFAKSLNLEVLLEVHNQEELERSLSEDIDLVGVNNRNLNDFTVSIKTSEDLAQKIPDRFIKISESGIDSPDSIKRLKTFGYKGFLIGEYFMRSSDPAKQCAELISKLST